MVDRTDGTSAVPASPRPAPLAGVRIFDMTMVAAGPWASHILGSLGATVIKIEPPGQPFSGDMAIRIPPSMGGIGTLWISANLYKKSIALNFKDAEHLALARRVAASCDVFVENMRPGVVARLGFGYEALQQLNPAILYVSVSGYGQYGPMAGEACTDPLTQAFSGWASITGSPGSPGEFYRHYSHIDLTTASFAALAVTLLLYRKRQTGEGGHLKVSMLDAALAIQTTKLAEYFATGRQPAPAGSACARPAPNQAFRCADGRYLTLAVESDAQWQRFCDAVGRPDLQALYRTEDLRVQHRTEVIDAVAQQLASKALRWWQLRLAQAAVPNGRILSFDDLLNDPQIRANELLRQVDTPFGTVWAAAPPVRFADTSPVPQTVSSPGADTDAVLRTLATEALAHVV